MLSNRHTISFSIFLVFIIHLFGISSEVLAVTYYPTFYPTYYLYAYNINDTPPQTKTCRSATDNCTIREALLSAERLYSEDEKRSFVLYLAGARDKGVYQLYRGELSISFPITITALKNDRAIIDGRNEFGIFNMNVPRKWVTFYDLVLRNGKKPDHLGGAIIFKETYVKFLRCLIGNNSALSGGAIYGDSVGSYLLIEDSTISNNTSSWGGGGGISYFGGRLKILNSNLKGNQAQAGAGDNMYLDDVSVWSVQSNSYERGNFTIDYDWTPQSSF